MQENIVRELEYQSSLELDPRTFDRLRRLPLASEIVRHARQDLVRRLDGYEVEQPEIFRRVIEFIEQKMMPIVVRHAISGVANINSEDPLFDDPVALAMLIDIFSERGFHATVDVTRVWRANSHRSAEREDLFRGEEGLPFQRALQKCADAARSSSTKAGSLFRWLKKVETFRDPLRRKPLRFRNQILTGHVSRWILVEPAGASSDWRQRDFAGCEVSAGFEIETHIWVSPEDDVEVRRLMAINHSGRTQVSS